MDLEPTVGQIVPFELLAQRLLFLVYQHAQLRLCTDTPRHTRVQHGVSNKGNNAHDMNSIISAIHRSQEK